VEKSITFIGLDVHKDTIAVALAEGGREEVREYSKIANTTAALQRLAGKLARGHELGLCYEVGPCGYRIQRQVTALGDDCVVVAPSLVPRKPCERIKTDRRDAVKLAKSHRAGDLISVWVPDPAHQAIRDLVRLRTIAVRSLRRARQELSGFLLRQSCHYPGRTRWTKSHRRWLSGLKFEEPVHYIVLEDCITAIEAPVVHALRSPRGLDLIVERYPAWAT
jgi:transposase